MNYEIATEQDVLNKYLAVAGGGVPYHTRQKELLMMT